MKTDRIKLKRWSPAFRWVAMFCLLLISASAVAQGFHSHANESAETSKHCSICPVLHSAIRIVQPVQVAPAFNVAEILHLFQTPDRHIAVDLSALFSRPPPSA